MMIPTKPFPKFISCLKNLSTTARLCLLIPTLLCAVQSAGAETSPFSLSALEDVAVQENGRNKPLLVLAMENLRTIYGADVWKDPETKQKVPALQVMMEMLLEPDPWLSRKIIRVDHLKLKKELGLEPSEKYFTYRELSQSDRLQTLFSEVLALREKDSRVKLEPMLEAARGVGAKMEVFERMATGKVWMVVPHPSDPVHGAWVTLPEGNKYYQPEQLSAAVAAFREMAKSYINRDQSGFDRAVATLDESLRGLSPQGYPSASILQLEHVYTVMHPFRLAWWAYGLAVVVLALTSLRGREWGYRVGWGLALLGFALQLSGFVARTVISGRAPVTNMYETVIWLGFGVMLFGLIFEAIYRCRYFLLGSAPVAVASLILADSLPSVLNSAIHPLVPVLRHNFWLTTHVLTITSSYAAMALALGVAHIILGKLLLKKEVTAALYQYLYRAIQIGVLLLGVGTILGGVWANYSWGRFWDWDPKETWALIAFLCYVAILHGRLAGWWGGFGLAVGAILAFQAVVMAWYGVNFVLGQGLHSYGFGAGGLEYVLGFTVLELIFVGAALLSRFRGGAVLSKA
ncbi:MAG: cytochrome c biogenesis protein CcsA [Blastochloris sp.]|nr:cytochrome c biogenesis protein CcsA [Blastochloris sp.]